MATQVFVDRATVNGREFVTATLQSPNGINPLATSTVSALRDVVRDVGAPGGAHALVIRAQGRCFSAGADVREFKTFGPKEFEASMRNIASLFFEMLECPRPVVSIVQADALGGGAAVAFFSDYVIAAEGATFALPEVHRGLAGLGYLLPLLVGKHQASEFTLLGRSFKAPAIKAMGLVNEVCDAESLQARSNALCEEISKLSPGGLAMAKRSLAAGMLMKLRDGMNAHVEAQAAAFAALEPGMNP